MNFDALRSIHTRRLFLQKSAGGLGTVALWSLMAQEEMSGQSDTRISVQNPLKTRQTHFEPRAKNVIFLFMEGGPSQLDLFDPKPEMKKWEGQPLPASMTKGVQFAFTKPTAKVWASPRTFTRYGQCGMAFSDYLPQTARCADDICMVRSIHTDQFNHTPAQLMLNCGTPLVGRPTMGAWLTYGLGSESQNLPGFVVLILGGAGMAGGANWSSGFLPSSYQGVPFRNIGEPVLYLSNPRGVSTDDQRMRLDAIRDLNEERFLSTGDLEIASRMASYELAFRMQTAAPELLDFSKESPSTLSMYGMDKEVTRPYATNCLLARRMVERGVRFVQLIYSSWDDHTRLDKNLKKHCDETDQPTAALLKDLKQRGLLESTLVVWGGEFGRTPMIDGQTTSEPIYWGRDHHPRAFSVWLAGGGIKSGQVVGRTDEFGFNGVEDQIHVHDLHATILHCLGLDHKRLTYRHLGRDFRLTDVEGQIVPKILS